MGIIGIGYEGHTIESFISRLRLRDVHTLVDVRLNAISRKRGFAKKALAAALDEAGIAYLHRPALGNERDNRDGYAELTSERAADARDRYRETLNSEAAIADLDELAALARNHLVAVLCFEADERHCHREQVIEAAQKLIELDSVST
ncbi:MAG: DUF488 domain-containing protein [Leifsonia sp.]